MVSMPQSAATQFPAHARDVRTDQGLVADEYAGEVNQDRPEGRAPRSLRRFLRCRSCHPRRFDIAARERHWQLTTDRITVSSCSEILQSGFYSSRWTRGADKAPPEPTHLHNNPTQPRPVSGLCR